MGDSVEVRASQWALGGGVPEKFDDKVQTARREQIFHWLSDICKAVVTH